MENFKEQQLDMLRKLGDVFNFSYNLQLINQLARSKPNMLVKSAENFYKWQIEEICFNIIKRKAKIIFVAGPSSSGKTTSALRIAHHLETEGKKARVISMDDFFIDLDKAPRLPDGTVNYESVDKIDVPYFKKFLKDILNNKTAQMPHYDFITDKRDGVSPFKIKKDEILIIEGLHALNPLFSKTLPKEKIYKVYVAVASNFTIGDKVAIDSKEVRLMRRILRDYYKRGTPVNETIEWWKRVREGERQNIFPFRPQADYLLNTTHMFEPLLYDTYLTPILKTSINTEVQNLLSKFKYTGNLSIKNVPKHSLIQEFIPNLEK